MARLTRLVVAGLAHHVIQRAVAGGHAFADDADRETFLDVLRRCSVEHHVAVHAYVLLEDEFQLLLTPAAAEDLSRMMQAVSRFYVPAFNRRHDRAGALWRGRFRAAPVGGAEPLLTCMLYIEQAPMRGGWNGAPADFQSSSASHNAGHDSKLLLSRVPSDSAYWQLGNTPFERDAAYRALLGRPLEAAAVESIERTTRQGWAFGTGEFLARLRQSGTRRPSGLPKGRPSTAPR